ncbi:hypothetical protein [Georgenia thermotolerans]|uniref:hypothetical protein n=1 Tax=Georgenia thermotolerans TaxID=527326 RepID=UPI001D01FD3A|nr:hypothetical protein [Georgenia thermotolerans]
MTVPTTTPARRATRTVDVAPARAWSRSARGSFHGRVSPQACHRPTTAPASSLVRLADLDVVPQPRGRAAELLVGRRGDVGAVGRRRAGAHQYGE